MEVESGRSIIAVSVAARATVVVVVVSIDDMTATAVIVVCGGVGNWHVCSLLAFGIRQARSLLALHQSGVSAFGMGEASRFFSCCEHWPADTDAVADIRFASVCATVSFFVKFVGNLIAA